MTCGIAINKQLEKVLREFTEDEVRESVDCYEENIERGKVIPNPQGWLVECLRGEWWKNSPKKIERRLEEAKIIDALGMYGKELVNPDLFFAQYWDAVDEGTMHDFDESRYIGDRVGYLLINEHGAFVCGINEILEYEMMPWQKFVG